MGTALKIQQAWDSDLSTLYALRLRAAFQLAAVGVAAAAPFHTATDYGLDFLDSANDNPAITPLISLIPYHGNLSVLKAMHPQVAATLEQKMWADKIREAAAAGDMGVYLAADFIAQGIVPPSISQRSLNQLKALVPELVDTYALPEYISSNSNFMAPGSSSRRQNREWYMAA